MENAVTGQEEDGSDGNHLPQYLVRPHSADVFEKLADNRAIQLNKF